MKAVDTAVICGTSTLRRFAGPSVQTWCVQTKYWSHRAVDCRDAKQGTASQGRGNGEASLSLTSTGSAIRFWPRPGGGAVMDLANQPARCL